MRTIIFTKLIALICGITTMTGINDKLNTKENIKNLSTICNQSLKEVQDWQTIQDLIKQLNYDEIDEIRLKLLLETKCLIDSVTTML